MGFKTEQKCVTPLQVFRPDSVTLTLSKFSKQHAQITSETMTGGQEWSVVFITQHVLYLSDGIQRHAVSGKLPVLFPLSLLSSFNIDLPWWHPQKTAHRIYEQTRV